jgi:hypothetical protein
LAKRYIGARLGVGRRGRGPGRYVTFAQPDGRPIGCHRSERTRRGRSRSWVGAHRDGAQGADLRTADYRPARTSEGKRPQLETKVLFRGIHFRLELDLAGKDKNRAGAVIPTFYSLAGEEVLIPKRFRAAVQAITKAVNRTGCPHSHFVRACNGGEAGTAVRTAATQPSAEGSSPANVA